MPEVTDLVFITGCTGHLGFRTLRYALDFGYPARAAVRSEAKAQIVKDTLQSLNISAQLEFVIVPDFTLPNAFDKALQGVKYIIHAGFPIATVGSADDDLDDLFVRPAVQGTMSLFASAKRTSTVERIVLTGSVAAIQPKSAWFEPNNIIYTPEDCQEEIQRPFPGRVVAYANTKIAALRRAEAFMEYQKPGFDAIFIMPSFGLGRDDLCQSTNNFMEGSNILVIAQALGLDVSQAPQRTDNFSSVDDCARVHVLSLDKRKFEGDQSFIVSSSGGNGVDWNDVNKIVKRRFAEAVEKGVFPENGNSTTVVCRLDSSKTEKVFGFKHASFEDCVVSTCGHYLELLEREKN